MPIRLARFLARAGVTSRRGAAELVASGRVSINGRPPLGPGDPVDEASDRVTVDGRALALPGTLWLALHKPPGFVTSRSESGRYPNVFTLLGDVPAGIVVVGRLDVLSEGLLLFTTDGDAAHRLMHPRWQVERTYRIAVTGRPAVNPDTVLAEGIALEEGPPVRPTAWRFQERSTGGTLMVSLREGRSRVVRRLAAQLGLGVQNLVRVAYGPIELGDLPQGRVRPLSRREVAALYLALGMSVPAPDREEDGR